MKDFGRYVEISYLLILESRSRCFCREGKPVCFSTRYRVEFLNKNISCFVEEFSNLNELPRVRTQHTFYRIIVRISARQLTQYPVANDNNLVEIHN